MGTWIAIATCLFIVGTIMSLKPSPIEQRLDKLRMTARTLHLLPKLKACPKWLRGKDNEYGKGMLAYYSVVDESLQLPLSRYQIIDGQWRPIAIETSDGDESDDTHNTDFSLDKVNVDFPSGIQPFIQGLSTQANCITIIWEDACYVKPATNKDFVADNIEPDLIILRNNLLSLASIIKSNH